MFLAAGFGFRASLYGFDDSDISEDKLASSSSTHGEKQKLKISFQGDPSLLSHFYKNSSLPNF